MDEVELDQVSLAIYEFRELWANRPNAEGKVLFQATVTPTDFGRAVFDAAQLVLKTHGVAGYAELWAMHPFPTVPLTVLGDILSSADHAA